MNVLAEAVVFTGGDAFAFLESGDNEALLPHAGKEGIKMLPSEASRPQATLHDEVSFELVII